jgi:hypothetical protein
METVALLLLVVLVIFGGFWIIRKNESLTVEDQSHLAPYKIETPETLVVDQTINLAEQTPKVTAKPVRSRRRNVSNTTQSTVTPASNQSKQKPAAIQPAKKAPVQSQAKPVQTKSQQPQKKQTPQAKPTAKPVAKSTPVTPAARAPRAKKSNN